MVKWMILLTLFVNSVCCAGQKERYIRFNSLIAEAKAASFKGDMDIAVARYDSAFDQVAWSPFEYFPAIATALKAERFDVANDFLQRHALYGADPANYSDSALVAFLASPDAQPYWNAKPMLTAKYLLTVDTALISEILHMVEVDRAVRENDVPVELMVAQDSIHFDRMIVICKERGYPNRVLGAKHGYWDLLLWHHRGADQYPHSRQWKEIIPYINACIAKGDLDPSYLCSFDDIRAGDLGEPLQWGCMLDFASFKGPAKLMEREALDKNRATVGWGPFEDYAKQRGWDLEKMVAH